jgi:alpha-acetolactate decarboxylase
MRPVDEASMHTVHQPYDIETFGMFRKIMLEGDFSAKVHLGAAMAKHPTTGVGAVADARGEITIYDGKLIVSYGKTGAQPDANSDSAALLAVGSADDWQSVTVERDIAPSEIESYLAAAAKAHGIDPDRSFPFEVQGVLACYVMHVNAAPTRGPHGMGFPMAITVETKGDQIAGRVAGLYVSADLVGIATHGGERTHSHWVSLDGTSTAHLDSWGLKAGTILMLPKPELYQSCA